VPSLAVSQTYLTLADNNLSAIPLRIPKNSRLSVLDLSGNAIRVLPPNLTRLTSINLSTNGLSELPQSLILAIESYSRLEILDLSSNGLTSFPISLSKLPKLKRLLLAANSLSDLPKIAGSLECLNLSQNRLQNLPDTPQTAAVCLDFNLIERLATNMPCLARLYLSMNRLRAIEPAIDFSKVEVLHISKNCLTHLPNLSNCAPKLTIFDGSHNLLTEFPIFPPSISKINLNGNRIRELPDDLSRFSSLNSLEVNNNLIQAVPLLPASIELFSAYSNEISTAADCEICKLTKLLLYHNKLTAIPSCRTSNITDFFLSKNLIKSIFPDVLPTSLTKFAVIDSQIKVIPADLFDLPKLAHLNLTRNQIQVVPDAIKNSKLTVFCISANPLRSIELDLPETLVSLALAFCGISELPPSISRLSSLQTLVASGNFIENVPPLPSGLKTLILTRNSLRGLPAELPASLVVGNFACNQIEALPDLSLPNVLSFDVSHNCIRSLCDSLRLPAVVSLKLGHNPIEGFLDLTQFPKLNCLDIVLTRISFEPTAVSNRVREILMSDPALFVSAQYKLITVSDEHVGYSEIVGQRPTMEDAIVVRSDIFPGLDLFCVLDGHGGSMTSNFAAYQLAKCLTPEFSEDAVRRLIERVSELLREQQYRDGATLAMALVSGEQVIVAHLGDSRVIVLKESGAVRFATQDHKPESRDELERILMAGGKVVEGRTDGVVAVARGLGDFAVHGLSHEPSITTVDLEPDDRWVILACDGVLDVLTNEDIGRISTFSGCARNLAYDLRLVASHRLSPDNISVIAVDLRKRPC
jgi:Leucine-rich repeat (LRR) protein/serine/threonine protein phosphatase PrpC